MLNMQNLLSTHKEFNGEWVVARPENYKYRSLIEKLKDAWSVFTGKCEAVKFHEQ
jgi:hypothetical protein